jgi:STE24 endopeptidase
MLWRTDGMIANAAAMGLWPGRRYVLMSDLLLETMTDEQLQSVFAHEIGHIWHRHMLWLTLAFLAMALASTAAGGGLERLAWWYCNAAGYRGAEVAGLMQGLSAGWGGLTVLGMVAGFGWVSRQFELQADAFAARVVAEGDFTGQGVPALGALRMASALSRIGVVNNLPLEARNFTHGSLARRIGHLQQLSASAEFAARFDRRGSRLRWLIVGGLAAGALGTGLLWMA